MINNRFNVVYQLLYTVFLKNLIFIYKDKIMSHQMREYIDTFKNFLIKEYNNKNFVAYKGVPNDFKPHNGPMFFTKFEQGAKHYAEQLGGYVIKAEINFKNPLIVDATKSAPIPIYYDDEYIGTFSEKDINTKIKSLGFDGLIINKKFGDEIDGWEILSFDESTRRLF